MNIPARTRVVKGPESRDPSGRRCPGPRRPVTWVLLGTANGVHLGNMAFSPDPERLIRLFPRCQPWPRQVFASSVALHALGFALVGWATHTNFPTPISTSPQQATRTYAVRYLVLNRPPTRLGPRPERRPPRLPAPVAPVRASATLAAVVNVVNAASQIAPESAPPSPPRRPAFEAEALAPGATVGTGQIIAPADSGSTGGPGVAAMLGFQAPTIGVDAGGGGVDRVPELVGGASSACPEPRPPGSRTSRQSAVAVAFVVDTNGVVDRATLEVIESPGQPRTDHRFHARVYVVGASVQMDPGRTPPAADDSVLTEEVASHVARLVFRPALREGHAIRSDVLVSCQTL
jgi:hypothetical protein